MKKKKKKKPGSLWKNILLLIITIILFLIVSELVFRLFASDYQKRSGEHIRIEDSHFSHYFLNVSFRKDPGVFRIVVLGDSFTFGTGMENGTSIYTKSYPRQLQALLKENFDDYNYEIFNYGLGGMSTLDEYYILEMLALKANPDLVIIGITTNDMILWNYNLDPIAYCDINIHYSDRFLRFLDKNWRLFNYFYIKYKYADYYKKRKKNDNSLEERCYRRSLERINDLLSEKQIPAVVVLIYETLYDYEKEYLRDYYSEERFLELKEGITSAGFEHTMYTSDYFLDIPYKEVTCDDDYHYSPKAYRAIAKMIYNYLLTNNMIPSCENQDCSTKLVSVEWSEV